MASKKQEGYQEALRLFAQGVSSVDVSRRLDVSLRTVRRWRASYVMDDSEIVEPAPPQAAPTTPKAIDDPEEFWRLEYLQAQADEDAARELGHSQAVAIEKKLKREAYASWQEARQVAPPPEDTMTEAELLAVVVGFVTDCPMDMFDAVAAAVAHRESGAGLRLIEGE